MAGRALRTGSLPHVAPARRRETTAERGRFDRLGYGRVEGGLGPPSRAEPANAAIPWPVPPSRGHGGTSLSVAPSSTEPAVVVLPRTAAAGTDDAPPVAPVDPVRDGVTFRRCPIDRSLRGVAIAAALHLAGVAGLLAMPRSEPSGGGGAAIETVELVMFDAPATVDQVAGGPTSPIAATVAEPEPSPVPEPAPPAAEPPASAEPVAAPVVEPPLPILVTRQAEDRVEAAPTPPAEPPPTAAAPAAPEARPAEPARKPEPVKTKAKAKAETRTKKSPVATAAAPGDAARTRTSGARRAGSQAQAAGSGTVADWRSSVLAALARAKRYPVDAHDRGVVGRVVIRFTVTREGTVTAVSLVTSSGAAVLDAATLAMPRRATFPPMPAGGPATQTFTAGVRYDLH